jgi:O-antigen/teichoic acid export membrane protein
VLAAYLLGKSILGVGLFLAGLNALRASIKENWGGLDLEGLPRSSELLGFAASSNLSATAILVFRESEVLWVGLLLNAEAAGLYKVAYMIVSLLSVPADPLILSVYPETNRLIVQGAWRRLRGFLVKVTSAALLFNAALAAGLVILGRWVLSVFGAEYTAAYPAMMVLLVGLAFNYSLFWNRPLLLSLGLQTFAFLAILAAGILKVALAIPLVPRFGYVMEAMLLSSYYVVSVGIIAWRGWHELGRRMIQPTAS